MATVLAFVDEAQVFCDYLKLFINLVPMAGVEPAQLSPLPPQDSVSTNSTTSAKITPQRRGVHRVFLYIKHSSVKSAPLWQIFFILKFYSAGISEPVEAGASTGISAAGTSEADSTTGTSTGISSIASAGAC